MNNENKRRAQYILSAAERHASSPPHPGWPFFPDDERKRYIEKCNTFAYELAETKSPEEIYLYACHYNHRLSEQTMYHLAEVICFMETEDSEERKYIELFKSSFLHGDSFLGAENKDKLDEKLRYKYEKELKEIKNIEKNIKYDAKESKRIYESAKDSVAASRCSFNSLVSDKKSFFTSRGWYKFNIKNSVDEMSRSTSAEYICLFTKDLYYWLDVRDIYQLAYQICEIKDSECIKKFRTYFQYKLNETNIERISKFARKYKHKQKTNSLMLEKKIIDAYTKEIIEMASISSITDSDFNDEFGKGEAAKSIYKYFLYMFEYLSEEDMSKLAEIVVKTANTKLINALGDLLARHNITLNVKGLSRSKSRIIRGYNTWIF